MTPRIRLIRVTDDEALADIRSRNRAFHAPWEPVHPDEYFTVAGQRADIAAALERHAQGDALPFVILDDRGEISGRVTLGGVVRGSFQSCRMGYWLAEEKTGRGLATEAVNAAVELAFTEVGLHRVQAGTLVHNTASQNVLARAGFERFGLAPRYLNIAGSWQDHILFQRLNPDE